MLKVKEYANFDEFEKDAHKQDVDLVAIVNKPNGMVRYGCTWSSGRRRRAWLADFTEEEREAAGRLFRMAHNWTVGRGVPDTVQMSRKTFHLWQKLGDFCASI